MVVRTILRKHEVEGLCSCVCEIELKWCKEGVSYSCVCQNVEDIWCKEEEDPWVEERRGPLED